MVLKRRASKKFPSFNLPVSFQVNETKDKLRDALNVFSSQGRLETRFGRSLFNVEALPGPVLSLTFFESSNGQKYLLAKCGDSIYSVSRDGAHVLLKSGLSPNSKHRGITVSRGTSSRHILAIEEDGLFQFNGTHFTQLGQSPPIAPAVTPIPGAVADGEYRVGLTYYSSSTGFESNLGVLSPNVSTVSKGIGVTGIPTTADNATIDKIRIYLLKIGSDLDPVFSAEIPLGVEAHDIISTPNSTIVPPRANGVPLAGGGKYLTEFNRSLVYTGNSVYQNDIIFAEDDLPDAFNDGSADGRKVLFASLDGTISGIATGLYNNSVLDPYLVVFKKRSTHIYSEIGGQSKFVPISSEIGCVSHDTIIVKNGSVFFLSEQGWRVIFNGTLLSDNAGNPVTLGNGDIDDIFRSPGYEYEINRPMLNGAFSVYHSTLDQYITWVAEAGGSQFSKAYVYEYKTGGFKPYQFLTPSTAACSGYESFGEVVYMADAEGRIYSHSSNEQRSDQDSTGTEHPIEAFVSLPWIEGNDLNSSHNFRELILRRLSGVGDILVRANLNFNFDHTKEFILENPLVGFVLDVSKLDIDPFGTTDRSIITSRVDLNCVGENVLISFYQKGIGLNIGLVAAQLDFSKNGNRN